MKMNKKGFTLIELLAVIVILAIIALIATPIILNIINDSREKSNLRSVEAFGKATETAVARLMMEANYDGGKITCASGASGTAKCSADNDVEVTITYSGSTVNCQEYSYTTSDNKKVTVENGVSVDEANGIITIGNCQVGSSSNRYTFKTDSSKGACQDNSSDNGKNGAC